MSNVGSKVRCAEGIVLEAAAGGSPAVCHQSDPLGEVRHSADWTRPRPAPPGKNA